MFFYAVFIKIYKKIYKNIKKRHHAKDCAKIRYKEDANELI